FQTAVYQPYAVFQGNLQAHAAYNANGIVDLALSPTPALVIDGFQNPAFQTDSSGLGGVSVTAPPSGTPPAGIPLNLQVAVQGVVGNPFNQPCGYSLCAATRATVTQGPIITFYSLGDEFVQSLNYPTMPMPFYGTNYTTLQLSSN